MSEAARGGGQGWDPLNSFLAPSNLLKVLEVPEAGTGALAVPGHLQFPYKGRWFSTLLASLLVDLTLYKYPALTQRDGAQRY